MKHGRSRVAAACLAAAIAYVGGTLIYSGTRHLRQPMRQSSVRADLSPPLQNPSAALDSNDHRPNTPAWKADNGGVERELSSTNSALQERGSSPREQQSPASSVLRSDEFEHWRRLAPVIIDIPSEKPTPARRAANTDLHEQQAQHPSAPPTPTPQIQSQPPLTASGGQPLAERASEPRTPPEPRVVTVEPGVTISVKLGDALSTDHNDAGDTFRGTLGAPLVVNGDVIGSTGAAVFGRVLRVKRSGLLHGKADLRLALTEINATDGQLIHVESEPCEWVGRDMKLQDAPKMAVGVAFGAIAGAISGAAKGTGSDSAFGENSTRKRPSPRTVVLQSGTELTFRIARPFTVTKRGGA